ncbi:PhnD/SsuA/transferrin family substrate-binding protein [candidate division CSSED10-310 bacterium]|uniref:PhnD/SsuA/transferrin family substrate-binding protein n=1 Tax=candidate division CSSED10-310 bacterium TaxID=2855610 RepID=A0ABV6Z002_UNCC1
MLRSYSHLLIACIFIIIMQMLLPFSGFCYEKGVLHRVVYFNPDVTIEDPIAAVSAMKPFTNFIGKKLGVQLEPYFFKKQVDLDRFIESNKVAFGIFSQMYIVENFRKRSFEPIAIVLKEGQPYYRKVVLVRTDSEFQTLADLEGKVLATTALGDDNIPFLNKVVFRGEIDVNTHFGKLTVVDSANSAIMAVMYKQADAAAANYLNYVFLQELNPQVRKQLKSIYTSAKTPLPGLVYFKGNLPQDLVDTAIKEMLIMHENPIGAQTMLAFQVEAWGPATIKDWADTARLLDISLSDQPVPKAKPSPEPDSVKTEQIQAEPEKPVEKEKPSIQFKRIVAIDNPEENTITVRAVITQETPGVDPSQVQVKYSISSGQSGTVKLEPGADDNFSGLIKLPAVDASQGAQKIEYTIKPGDTMGKIAKKLLGDSRKYMLIATFNKIENPNVIYAGTKLTVISGEFSGLDIDYDIVAVDKDGHQFQSRPKFISVIR